MLRAMAADELVLIRAGRFIDVLSGEVRARQAVLVRGDRVQSVGEDDGSAPEGARDDGAERVAAGPRPDLGARRCRRCGRSPPE